MRKPWKDGFGHAAGDTLWGSRLACGAVSPEKLLSPKPQVQPLQASDILVAGFMEKEHDLVDSYADWKGLGLQRGWMQAEPDFLHLCCWGAKRADSMGDLGTCVFCSSAESLFVTGVFYPSQRAFSVSEDRGFSKRPSASQAVSG